MRVPDEVLGGAPESALPSGTSRSAVSSSLHREEKSSHGGLRKDGISSWLPVGGRHASTTQTRSRQQCGVFVPIFAMPHFAPTDEVADVKVQIEVVDSATSEVGCPITALYDRDANPNRHHDSESFQRSQTPPFCD